LVEGFELLERERELQALSAVIAAVCRGTGRLAVVEGAAGIGKTRLLVAARAVAERDGLRVLGARGSELEREFAYGIVRQLFEPALTGAGQAGRAELLAGAAGQAAMLFGHVDAAAAASAGGDVSFATLHGLFWLAANLCARGPLMLVVDDLHWADGPSLRFLAYLLSRLEGLPLVVLVGLRPAEPVVDQQLLTQVTTDPVAMVVRPAPLSQAASVRLVRTMLTEDAQEEFCLACHTASGANPLLLHELVGVALAEGLEPTAAEVARLAEIGPRAVRQRVALRLARLGPAAAALCAAVAILGDGADPRYVATLAGLQPAQVWRTARQLIDIGILYRQAPSPDDAARLSGMLGFVHPLVRDAVYEGLSETERLTGHARAARLLSKGGKTAEQVAAHLLRVPPAADSFVVATLRQAADEAFARGSPESAVSALERCLQEPPPDTDRADILLQLGTAAQLVDMVKGADYLTAAMDATHDPVRKATIAEMLGIALQLGTRHDEAAGVLSKAVHMLGNEYADLRWRLEAGFIIVALAIPALQESVAQRVSWLRDAPPHNHFNSRILNVSIAFYDALAGQRAKAAVAHVRRGLADGILIEQAHLAVVFGFLVLITADVDDAMPLLDAWVAAAHQRGSLLAYGPATCYRGLAWLSRGALAEAEADIRDSMWTVEKASANVGRPFVGAHLADVLMEQDRLDEAAAALDWACMSDPLPPPDTGIGF
jgi:tetratricopeptide (TPR) repeat protein